MILETIYLSIGISWGVFCLFKQKETYGINKLSVFVGVPVNVCLWPMSVIMAGILHKKRTSTLDTLEHEINMLMIQAANEGNWETHTLLGKIKEYDLFDLREIRTKK